MPRGKRQPLTIAGYEFESQKEAIAFFSNILRTQPQMLPLSGQCDSVLKDLLAMHPRAEDKGGDISHFSIGPDGYRGICFHLHRTDGSSSDFSFRKCLQGERLQDLVFGAMRTEIMSQIRRFRQTQFTETVPVCPFTGVALNSEDCHVDHTPPMTFHRIAHEWLANNQLNLGDVQISQSQDNQTSRLMTDGGQSASWTSWHQRHALLRLTTVLGNLSHSKREASAKIS
jgi:hypothetical protein